MAEKSAQEVKPAKATRSHSFLFNRVDDREMRRRVNGLPFVFNLGKCLELRRV